MPFPQCSLHSALIEMIKKAKEKPFFPTILTTIGHYLNKRWYCLDSLQSKIMLPELRKQLHVLYGDCTLRVQNVQLQRGDTDCGCFMTLLCYVMTRRISIITLSIALKICSFYHFHRTLKGQGCCYLW